MMRIIDRLGQVRVAGWWVALGATLLGVVAVQAITSGPAGAVPLTSAAAVSPRYLNLHQCVYWNAFNGDHFTTVLRNSTGGTNVSNLPESGVNCVVNANYRPNLSAVLALDLTAGRYLNLHQCVYWNAFNGDHFTTVLRNSTGGTNVSNLPESGVNCVVNANYRPNLSAVLALDLLG